MATRRPRKGDHIRLGNDDAGQFIRCGHFSNAIRTYIWRREGERVSLALGDGTTVQYTADGLRGGLSSVEQNPYQPADQWREHVEMLRAGVALLDPVGAGHAL